jgi:tetratricopeptide (TPR) repeat protein
LLEKNGNDNALTEYLSEAALAAYLCNDLQAAVKYSDRMVELAPATMLHNDRHLYDMIRVAALYPEKARLWQKAAHYADVAIELFEKTPGALNRVSQMQFYSSAGEKKMLLNKNAEALADFKKQEQLSNTGSAEDMFWHASALVRIGRCSPSIDDQMKYYAKGMQQIEQAGAPDIANLLEQYCEACLYTADNLMRQRQWEDALPYLQKGLAIVDTKMMKNPAHIFAKSNQRSFAIRIAAIQRNLGKTDEARSVEEKYNLKTLHKER